MQLFILSEKVFNNTAKITLCLFKLNQSFSWNNRKLKQRECWRPRGQKLATRNWSFLSFSGLSRQICTVGVKTKAFRFIVRDRSISSNETSNFWLLFMMSGTSVISLLKLSIILDPVTLGKKTALSPVTQIYLKEVLDISITLLTPPKIIM